MKKLVEVQEVEGQGMESLLGEVITLFCCRYIYTGKLTGVNDTFVLLEAPSIVYETGDFKDKDWENAEQLPHKEWRVTMASIESYGVMK